LLPKSYGSGLEWFAMFKAASCVRLILIVIEQGVVVVREHPVILFRKITHASQASFCAIV
jgi:hypothetical protein